MPRTIYIAKFCQSIRIFERWQVINAHVTNTICWLHKLDLWPLDLKTVLHVTHAVKTCRVKLNCNLDKHVHTILMTIFVGHMSLPYIRQLWTIPFLIVLNYKPGWHKWQTERWMLHMALQRKKCNSNRQHTNQWQIQSSKDLQWHLVDAQGRHLWESTGTASYFQHSLHKRYSTLVSKTENVTLQVNKLHETMVLVNNSFQLITDIHTCWVTKVAHTPIND